MTPGTASGKCRVAAEAIDGSTNGEPHIAGCAACAKASHKDLRRKLDELEKRHDQQFQMVFEAIRRQMAPAFCRMVIESALLPSRLFPILDGKGLCPFRRIPTIDYPEAPVPYIAPPIKRIA